MSRTLRVLVVEDSEDDTLLLIRELRRGGYDPVFQRVDTRADMNNALDRRQWDIVIADYSLPNFSAPEALGLLKERGFDLPFIIVSGSIGEDTAVAAMKSGAHDYIMKDNFARLLPAIARELREAVGRRERKKAEEALRESEERYRDLFENANDIIYTLDLEGNFTSFNRTGERITGYSRDEIIGSNFANIVKPGQQDVFHQMLKRKLAGEEQISYELEIVAKDGRQILLDVSTRLIYKEGRPVGVQGIARDVTERKSLEAQLRQAQKMESIGTLAGGIAHDFNNILTGIIGFADLALFNLSAQHPLYHSLQEIKNLGERAARLTRQLLAFARKQMLEPQPFNLNDVITDLSKFLRRVIGEHIDLQTILANDLAIVHADVSQIEQVLVNLCVNARDAMSHGGKLVIETRNVDLDEMYCQTHPWAKPGNYVLLSVSDTGVGMDRATQERIFEPFFTTKELGQGTGLGLAMVYGIIKQHEGLIHVYSEPGHGSTFKIYLPAISGQAKAAERPIIEAPRGGSETILIAEDETSVRELIVAILETQGYSVLTASNGEDAVRVFEQNREGIDLIISDAVMPRLGGRELYEILQRRFPALKFLFISGYSVNAMSERFIIDEGLELLHKPFNTIDLIRKVRELLDR